MFSRLFEAIFNFLTGSTIQSPRTAHLVNNSTSAPVADSSVESSLSNLSQVKEGSSSEASSSNDEVITETFVFTVDSSGQVSIPAWLLSKANFASACVDVRIHPNSLTIKDGVGDHENLKVHADGRVRLTRRIMANIGLTPGDKVKVRNFYRKLVISKHRD